MDGRRFDDLTRALGAPGSRRRFLKGLLGAGLAAAGIRRFSESAADAQVSQIYCGNQMCASNPGGCKPGCVCCVYTNPVTGSVTNSRCRPPGTCSPGATVCPPGQVLGPSGTCAAPTTTTTTTTTSTTGGPPKPLGSPCAIGTECESGFCTDGVCCVVASCGQCRTCSVGPEPGTCFDVFGPSPSCPSEPCNQGICTGGRCTQQPAGDNVECGEGDECNRMVCFGGSCLPQSANEGDPCGGGGTECNPKICVNGSCQSDPGSVTGYACTGGLCYGGSCCKGGTTDGICGIGENRTCCATEPCCGPGSCCVDCFSEPSDIGGPDERICCPATSLCPRDTPGAPDCCYSYQECIQTAPGVYGCVHEDRVCGGAICDGDCCGTDCCEDGQYCDGTACVPVPDIACTTDAQCGTNLRCTGVAQTQNPQTGEITSSPGSCCPANRYCQTRDLGPPDGQPYDTCLAFGLRCGYPGPTASCLNSKYVLCRATGTPCDCSPRGGRTRL